VSGQNPRQIAARVLGQRRPGGEFTENLLDRALERAALSGPDRGLCHELVLGVVRWQATLDWLIERKTPGRTQKAALQDLLRLGLYQIFWLDRIPPHAAVHETVEQAKQSGYGPQAGFINALLRGYLREADATRRLLEELQTAQPALGWSHPDWLVERWRKEWGSEATQRLLEWNNTPAKTYARVNTLRTDAGKLVAAWRGENVEYDFFTRDWTGENLPWFPWKVFGKAGFTSRTQAHCWRWANSIRVLARQSLISALRRAARPPSSRNAWKIAAPWWLRTSSPRGSG
jgi:16S rRNA (cytosine967-C5)-methyltransferase